MIEVPIPAEFEPFVEAAVRDGRYRDSVEVVGEGLRLLARREKLLCDVKAGVEQLDRGDYTEYDEKSLDDFLAVIKAEERARFPNSDNRS